MAQYGSEYRGKRITVVDGPYSEKAGVSCVVEVDGVTYPHIKGIPFATVGAAQAAGAAFGRALIDSLLDGDSFEHKGYFIRTSSQEQRDGTWAGGYQLHRNDNPIPFRRASCELFRGNTSAEAEANAVVVAREAIDAEVAAGKL